MTGLYESCAAGVITFWCVYRLSLLVLPRNWSVFGALLIGFAPFFVLPWLLFYAMIVAVFAPFGLLLPIMAVQELCRDFGWRITRIATPDLVVFLVLYLLFLSASVGVFAWDPYRLGYDPLWGGAVAIILCLYAVYRGHLAVALAAVAGQFLWMQGIGSSNFFDHISHALFVPVILISLIRRFVTKPIPEN